jgi:hypothetical protein
MRRFLRKPGALHAPAAESVFERVGLFLAEWEIRLYARYIGRIYKRCFAQAAFALSALGRQQMASRRVRAQYLAARREFKTLGYCFTCFAPRN